MPDHRLPFLLAMPKILLKFFQLLLMLMKLPLLPLMLGKAAVRPRARVGQVDSSVGGCLGSAGRVARVALAAAVVFVVAFDVGGGGFSF